ncbi:MAG: DNA-directed RNA polymerase subunit alpha [Thermomicrobiales bacterium]|nr:DNA-directed RNA polymerase subunit alpha [Thermomicrobiales bacterium]MCO5229116.1 DNA-directed RNA polymerase subunit alpha [Thermomicrobiales bacterium]
MLHTPDFKIEKVEEGRNYGRFQVEPLEPGYGTTMGNSLRRILLRSLEGCAVSRIRVDNVWHEFATIAGVREDVTEIVLNLKAVRLRQITELHGDVRAHLYVRNDGDGERVITADDIEWPVEVELINPDQHIATLSERDAVIDMDLWITRGQGYRPAEAQETVALGEIPIDSIFTPIERVNYVIEQTRVGSEVDYDRLILEILTDGAVEPEDALSHAAQILMAHARVFAEFTQPTPLESAENMIPEEVQNKPLADLGLSPRVLNALRSKQIDKVGQVLTMDPDQLLSIRNFGPRSMGELREKMAEFGYLPEGAVDVFGGSADADEDVDFADAIGAADEEA